MVRDIGDTTVQVSWSRGFDNHSPIAKYTLQARTPPAGKWKQVRTSKCEAPPGSVLIKPPLCAQLETGSGGQQLSGRLQRELNVALSLSREHLGRQGSSHSQQESKERTGGGTCAFEAFKGLLLEIASMLDVCGVRGT